MSDDRFKAVVARLCAMNEVEMGLEEGQALLGEFMSLAPPELQAEMREKFQELCPPLPAPTRCGPNGEKLWTDQQLADYLGEPVGSVRERIEELRASGVMGAFTVTDTFSLN